MAVWRISNDEKEVADSVRRRVISTILLLEKFSKIWTVPMSGVWLGGHFVVGTFVSNVVWDRPQT